jgi:hypothetical protein
MGLCNVLRTPAAGKKGAPKHTLMYVAEECGWGPELHWMPKCDVCVCVWLNNAKIRLSHLASCFITTAALAGGKNV